MAGQGVVLGALEVVVLKQGGRVVLGAIDHAGLQGAEDFPGVHGDAVAAHGVHHVDEQRVALYANLHAFEVFQAAHRLFGVDAARAAVHPGQGHQVEVGVGDLVEDLLADLAIDDLAHVLMVAEHERHVEHVHIRHYRADDPQADAGHLHGADLSLFDHFLFRSQHAAGEHLEGNVAIAGLFQLFTHVLLGDHGRVAGRVDFGELDVQCRGGHGHAEGEREYGKKQLAFERHDETPWFLLSGFVRASVGAAEGVSPGRQVPPGPWCQG
ncbi:hypothetical protein D3C80_906500 [compost metagenome]